MSMDWLPNVFGGVAGLGLGIADAINQYKMNEWQKGFAEKQFNQQQENWQASFDYQKDLNQQVFDREDTAVQRRVKDLESAGMSKWLAAGQGASSTPVSTSNGNVGGQSANLQGLDLKGSVLAGINVAQQVQGISNATADKANTIADTGLKTAETNTERKNALLKEEEILNKQKDTQLKEAQKNNINRNTEKQSKEMQEIDKRIDKINSEIRSIDYQNATVFYNLSQSMSAGLRTTDQVNANINSINQILYRAFNTHDANTHDFYKGQTKKYIQENK